MSHWDTLETVRAVWRLFALLLALATCLTGSRARGDETPMLPAARVHYDQGMALYSARDYPAAIRAFEAAFALDPRREILFARAQATRLSGDCPGAVVLYQQFLATGPPARQVEATRIALARCAEAPRPGAVASEDVPREARNTPPAPRPERLQPVAPPPPAIPAVDATSSRPARWYHDRLGGALAVASGLALATSAVLTVAARGADADARALADYGGYDRGRARAEARLGWARAALAGGLVLGAGAASRYLWIGLHEHPAVVTVGGRF